MFVQLTYSANINKKIRESIYWLLSEDNISYYLKQLKDAFWSYDQEKNENFLKKSQNITRTNEEKVRDKNIAKKKLLNNIPGWYLTFQLIELNSNINFIY
jgi:hypothetical protein